MNDGAASVEFSESSSMRDLLATSKGIVTIRPAVPEDAGLVRELRLEALAGHPESFAADYVSTAAESVAFWGERIANNALENKGVICIATTEDGLIGMIGLIRGHWPKTRWCGTLWGVYVKADWQGLHVAQALVEACITWAQVQGLVMVKLGVITTNTPAIRCYTRCGFTVYGVDPKVIHYNDVFYDELLMAKQI